jgi:predicted MPP superfamily phosphohydrolase
MLQFQFILIGISTLSLIWWFWADRRLKAWVLPTFWRWMLALSALIFIGGFIWISLARSQAVNVPLPAAIDALILIWAILALPFIALPMMAAWAVCKIGCYFRKPSPSPVAEDFESDGGISRRKVLKATAIALPVFATLGTVVYCLPKTQGFRIRNLTISIKDLPEALDGIRIAQVTDTHVGMFARGRYLKKIAEATNRLKADLVLLTGDLIDNSIDDLPEALAMVKAMDRRSGLFIIEGNHDLYDNPEHFISGVRDAGFTLLRNQGATVLVRGHPVQILGLVWGREDAAIAASVATVVRLRDPAAFPILLSHHPHAFDAAVEHGFPLTLSGHTHGGQLMLTSDIGVGPMMFRYWSGLYRKGTSSLVVSNGVGNWFPLRINAPTEIIHLTLRRA